MARIPPHDLMAEESVLGALLLEKDAINLIADNLKPEHFYTRNNASIYQAILDLFANREPVDLLTVSHMLKSHKLLEEVGGFSHLTSLAEKVPTTANLTQYAQIIKDAYIKRQLISMAAQMTDLAFDESKKLAEILDLTEQTVFSLSQANLKRNFTHIRDTLAESFDRLDELHRSDGGMRGVPTGLPDLDHTLSGLQPSNLLILAARPGMGKTALALNVAHHVAVERNMPVGFFSLEMSREELVDRLLVSQADIDAWKLKTGRLGEDEYAKLSDAMGVLADAPLYIDDTPGMSVLEMRTKARRLAAEVGLKLVIMDYITLARPSKHYESRVQEVGEISMGLKNLARELKIPVIALSQLNRSVEHRGSAQPQLADLRESGSIEQDADVVMFLYREDAEDRENVKLSVAKHRNGPVGTIELRFLGNKMKFVGVDRLRTAPPA